MRKKLHSALTQHKKIGVVVQRSPIIEAVARENISTILYVSHREDEFRDFFSQHIRMG